MQIVGVACDKDHQHHHHLPYQHHHHHHHRGQIDEHDERCKLLEMRQQISFAARQAKSQAARNNHIIDFQFLSFIFSLF